MTINKFTGKTKEEAIGKAKDEFGANAVIMNVKEVKPKGLLGFFKNSTYEVTAAVEEKEQSAAMQFLEAIKKPGKIDYKADENIQVPPVEKKEEVVEEYRNNKFGEPEYMENEKEDKQEETKYTEKGSNLDQRFEALSNILGDKHESTQGRTQGGEELKFVRILYNTLLSNEVSEKYINQVLEEIERFLRPGNSVDVILSNVYQKLVLRFGQPNTIKLNGTKPRIVFFIGPTGVGKTTTIAKIASKFKVDYGKKIAFITADTYRIAATEQLKTYANILDAPMSIVYTKEDLNSTVESYIDYDVVFVDTAGFSHKNENQRADIKQLIDGLLPEYEKDVYLVLSATTKYNDLTSIVDAYNEISDYRIIFTKLDETSTYGNLLNIKLYSDADISYSTNGQNVPDDIEVFDTQKIVKQLLGGRQ